MPRTATHARGATVALLAFLMACGAGSSEPGDPAGPPPPRLSGTYTYSGVLTRASAQREVHGTVTVLPGEAREDDRVCCERVCPASERHRYGRVETRGAETTFRCGGLQFRVRRQGDGTLSARVEGPLEEIYRRSECRQWATSEGGYRYCAAYGIVEHTRTVSGAGRIALDPVWGSG